MRSTTLNDVTHTILPSTSLIICSRDRPKLLWEAVRSVLAGQEIPTEIIIVDQSDAAHPRLATFIDNDRHCDVRYFQIETVGVSQARNRGAALAQYDILAFIDDDVLTTPTWFSVLVRALLEAARSTIITGQVLAPVENSAGCFAPSTKRRETPEIHEGRIGTDVLYTGNMVLFRSTLSKIGGFDEQLGPGTLFPAAEDNDLGYRMLEAGYRIVYEPRAVVYHRAWRTEADFIPLRWRYGRGQGAYYAKHLSLGDTYMLRRMCSDIFHRACRLPLGVWRQPRWACGEIAFVSGILLGAIHWVWTQRRTHSC